MKEMFTHLSSSLLCVRTVLMDVLVVLALGASLPRLAAQSDDFNDGNANNRTTYSLPNLPPNTPPYYLPEPGYYGAATY